MIYKLRFPSYIFLLTSSILLLAACALHKEYEAKNTVPDDIMGALSHPEDTLSLGAVEWRSVFTDPLLQQLIERAMTNNTDVRRAQLTIEQVQNDLTVARQGNIPTVSFQPTGMVRYFDSATKYPYSVPLVASWQLNILGQTTTKVRQTKARKEMYADYRQAVKTSLAANVAATYYALVMLDRKMQILEETQVVWEESLESMRTLYEAGVYQSPAVYQMEASLASVRAGIVETQEDIETTESALCLLLSEVPHKIERSPYGTFKMPDQLHIGIPLRLLSARPDVRQAARNMEIAYYDTQSAHQALYPNITISANLGWSNGEEGTVNPGTLLAKAVASIVQPIFAQGKLRARYRNAGIEQEKVRLQFEQTLLNAGNEVYRYLHICQKTEEKVQHLSVMVNALHEAYLGTKELMNNGTNTYLEVLKAQEDLLTAQLREVENHNDGVQALINLYIALGGAVE